MIVKHVTPILNVSNLVESFAWFEMLGWSKHWDYGDPPDFGAVRSGKAEIFLCLDGQGGRDVWMTWWVPGPADVDAVHALAVERGLTVTQAPIDYPWNTRECHIRHPDGHTFRVSAGFEET